MIDLSHLMPEHLADLRRSGLSDQTILTMGATSLNGRALHAAIYPTSAGDTMAATGYAIPYRDASGQQTHVRYRVFWQNPTEDSPKYLSPVGAQFSVYIPQKAFSLMAKHPFVLITEGEKKAEKAVEEGFPCVAIPGVSMWFDADLRLDDDPLDYRVKPLKLLLSSVTQKKTIIAFDSDKRTNRQVSHMETQLKDALLFHADTTVRSLSLPEGPAGEKQGLDDLLVAAGAIELDKLIQDCLARPPMGMSPLVSFTYRDAGALNRPLRCFIPNTPLNSKHDLHRVIREVEEKTEEGTVKIGYKTIATTRVWLSRLIRSIDNDGTMLYELGYVPLNDRLPQMISGDSSLIRMTGRSTEDPLADRGARVLSKERPELEAFLNDCQTYGVRQGQIPMVNGTRRRGWLDSMGDEVRTPCFVTPNRVITSTQVHHAKQKKVPLLPVDTGSDALLRDAMHSKGDVHIWRDHIFRYILPSPMASLFLAASMSGLLRHLCPDSENFIVHLYGESSAGKTTAMRVAASFWGSHEKMIDFWRTTDNGLESRCVARNDMVILLDEAGMNQNEAIVANAVYMIGNGGEKIRAGRSGESRKSSRFKIVALSTGEKPLTRGDQRFAGQEVRALELHADLMGPLWPTIQNGAEAEALVSAMGSHHGFGLEPMIKALLAQPPHAVHNRFCEITKQLRERLPEGTPPHLTRRVKHFGLMLTVWQLFLTAVLELEEEEAARQWHTLMDNIATHCLRLTTDQFQDGESESVLRNFLGRVVSASSHFLIHGNDPDTVRGDIYGVRDGKKLYVVPGAMNDLCKPFDPSRVLHMAEAKNVLMYDKTRRRRGQKITRAIGDIKVECYCFDLNLLEQLGE